jgi:hypothetical protein
MQSVALLDCAGRAPLASDPASFHQGRSPRNKGVRYPPDPPTVEEIVAVMRSAGDDPDGVRLRGVFMTLWRAGLRISKRSPWPKPISICVAALCSCAVAATPGGRHGPLGVGAARGVTCRPCRPAGWCAVCVLRGPTRGRSCAPAGIRVQLRNAAARAGVRRRFAPHQLRHAHAVEMSREGVPLLVIQCQLGHADLGITSAYLRGIDNTEIIHTVHERPAPVIPATSRLARDR